MFKPELPQQPVRSETFKDLITLESHEAEIEALAVEREGILKKIITSRSLDRIGNWIPGVNAIKLGIESAVGKTSSQRKLSGTERIIRALESGALMLIYVAVAEEMYGSISDEMFQAAVWSKFVANASHIYLNKDAVRTILTRFIENHQHVKDVFEGVTQAITALPDSMFTNEIIQLNLNG